MKTQIPKFKLGERFYTMDQGAQKFGVSRVTAGRAMRILVEEGYLIKSPNGCFYVKDHSVNARPELIQLKLIVGVDGSVSVHSKDMSKNCDWGPNSPIALEIVEMLEDEGMI